MKISQTKYVLDNKWMKVRNDTVQFPAHVSEYFTMEGPDWVMVCGVTPEKEILFVNQHRISIGMDHLELPAGKMDRGDESPLQTAAREFTEETGFGLTEIHHLGTFNTLAGRSNVKGHLFCALTGEKGAQHLDEDERVKIESIPISTVWRLIHENKVHCLPSLTTLLLSKEKYPQFFK